MVDNTSTSTTLNPSSRPSGQSNLVTFLKPGKPASVTSGAKKRKLSASTAKNDAKAAKMLKEIIQHNMKIRDIAKRASQFCTKDSKVNARFVAFKAARLARKDQITGKKQELHDLALGHLNNPTHELVMGNSQAVEGATFTEKGIKDIRREDGELAELELSGIDDSDDLLEWVQNFCWSDTTMTEFFEAVDLIRTNDVVQDDPADRGEDDNLEYIRAEK